MKNKTIVLFQILFCLFLNLIRALYLFLLFPLFLLGYIFLPENSFLKCGLIYMKDISRNRI